MLKVQHWNLCLLHLTVPTKILPQHPESMNTINCKITFARFEIYCNTFVDMALSQDGLKLCSTCNKTDRGNSEGTVKVPWSVHATTTLLLKMISRKLYLVHKWLKELLLVGGTKLLLFLEAYNYFNNFEDILAMQYKNYW